MIYIRQDRPGFITVDLSKEPKFDYELHGSELSLGLFTIESNIRQIVAEDSGQLGHVLDYICNWLISHNWKYDLDAVLEHGVQLGAGCSLVPGAAWCQAFVLCYWAERGIRKTYPKLLVARSTNRMQFDPQINTERDRLSEIVKMIPLIANAIVIVSLDDGK